MIDFACKQFDLDEIIKCALSLSKADLKIMKFLMKNDEKSFTSEELSKKLELDITTVQRGVKKLNEKDVLLRQQKNLGGGGYLFYYRIKGKKAINELIMGIVHRWVGKVEAELKGI